jgi:hypothetical protein
MPATKNRLDPNTRFVFMLKSIIDACDQMDGYYYRMYFAEELLAYLPPQSVIVVDSGSYHSRKEEQLLTESGKETRA